jgi:hypothetical protein
MASIESQSVNIVNSVRSGRSRRSMYTPRFPSVAAYAATPVCSRYRA